MTEQQKVHCFDEKIMELEGERNYSIGGSNPLAICAEILSFFFMLIPINEIQKSNYFLAVVPGLLLMSGSFLRMQWLLVLIKDGRQISWKKYLKYVPVDWREYRRHRYQLLMKYAGKMSLCMVLAQLLSQIFSGNLLETGYQWIGIIYVAAMCFVFILVPGVIRIWRWS